MQCSSGIVPLADTRTTVLLPLHIPHSRPSPIIIPPWPFFYSPPNSSSSKSSFKLLCRRGSRDSVAETISNFRSRIRNSSSVSDDIKSEESGRSRRRRKRKRVRRAWWSDNEYLGYDEEEGPAGILEEFIDSAWIFKVFLSYGWMLPLITLSLLIVSGPKAFLMTMALPFGISLLTLIINKLKHFSTRATGYYYNNEAEDDDDAVMIEEEEFPNSKTRQKKKRKDRGGRSGYQSWVAAARRRRTNNESRSVNRNGVNDGGRDSSSLSSFGGWEDLVIVAGEGSGGSNGSKRETDTSRGGHKSAPKASNTP